MDHDDYYNHTRRNVQKEKAVKKGIAFFDFDGTITTKDTLLEFIRYSKGNLRFLLGFLINAHYLVAMKLKMISNQKAKEKVLEHFFKGIPVDEFELKCHSFYKLVLPGLIRKGAVEEIQSLKKKGMVVVVVSASPENWIRDWAKEMAVELIASKLQVVDAVVSGKIMGNNCYGQEKVRRIKEKYNIGDYEQVYAYGDTKGDLPMLELAHNRYFKPFRKPVQNKHVPNVD